MNATLRQTLTGLLVISSFWLAPTASHAHGDEDHGQGKPAAIASSPATPVAEAKSDLFELVARLKEGKLIIYLDRFSDNTPITDAKIEVESGRWRAIAKPFEDGTYQAVALELAKPGKYPLVFTVSAGKETDLLEATLSVGTVHAPATNGRYFPKSVSWLGGGALAVFAAGIFVYRRRASFKRQKGAIQ